MLGGHSVVYDCPDCGDELVSSDKDLGHEDNCPKCASELIVPSIEDFEHCLGLLEAQKTRENDLRSKRKSEVRDMRLERKNEERRRQEADEAAELFRLQKDQEETNRYPYLYFYMGIVRFFTALLMVASIIAGLLMIYGSTGNNAKSQDITTNRINIVYGIVLIISGFLLWIITNASIEVIKVFLNIEKNTRSK